MSMLKGHSLSIWPSEPGDVDGFLALSLNNLIQILLIIGLCRSVLGYPDDLLFKNILPASGLSLLAGNFAYARMATQLSKREGRTDCTALPYGINTVSLFAYVFLVMLPVKFASLNAGLTDSEAVTRSWHVGMVACLGSGLIELAGACIAQHLRKWLPRAALLSTLSGIAMGYIAMGFLLRTYSHPLVGLSTLVVILLGYYGKVKWPLPTGLIALLLGMSVAWSTGLIQTEPGALTQTFRTFGLSLPTLQLQVLWTNIGDLLPWLGVIVPMGLFNVVGSLQNLESAEAAGDSYAISSCLFIDGIGTLVAAAFGSCFPTTIYIGHPGFKSLGARAGYSLLNGVAMASACCLGIFGLLALVIPIDAGMAIMIYIGLAMTAQAFQATPSKHAPAVVLGILPGLAGWGAQLLKAGLRAGGLGSSVDPFGPEIIKTLVSVDVWAAGAFALEQGQIITAMLLSGLLVYVIEGRFLAAAACSGTASILAWFGVIHGWRFSTSDTALHLGWGTGEPWALAYAAVTLIVLLGRLMPRRSDSYL